MTLLDKTVLDDAVLSEATSGDYLELLKPRVMSLVVFTAFVGLVAAPVTLNPFIAVIAILSVAIGAGASGALNMWYDADIDAVMSRTASRPVPTGRSAFWSTGSPAACSPSPSSSMPSSTPCG
jgi:protoheme IX farnesyltransferase